MAALLAILLVGCAQQNDSMDQEELEAFASRYAAAWSSQDARQLAAQYAENGTLQINDGEPAVGREAISAVAESFMTALPDMVVRMDSVRIQDGVPEFHWTLLATNSGPGGNGNSIHVSGYEEWIFSEDALIEQSLGHMDTAEYERQLEYGASDQ